jgi:AcrR family transcriptional regulator
MARHRVADRSVPASERAKTKGQRTRARIVREAADLFNVRGYSGTSVADVSAAAGLEKGGVYNHFESKDALAMACFEYAAGAVLTRLNEAARSGAGARERIFAILELYSTIAGQRLMKGGCPILNTAVEADDTHPALSALARGALNSWRATIRDILSDGMAAGEFRLLAPADEIATAVVAALEGGMMLIKIYREPALMRAVTAQLSAYLQSILVPDAR